MVDLRSIAEGFSSHRFSETYAFIAEDVVWFLPGAATISGKAGVIDACEQTLADLADSTTEFLRFLVVADSAAVAVDAIGRYTSPDGKVSVVSSSDFYEFRGDEVVAITSYAVELEP